MAKLASSRLCLCIAGVDTHWTFWQFTLCGLTLACLGQVAGSLGEAWDGAGGREGCFQKSVSKQGGWVGTGWGAPPSITTTTTITYAPGAFRFVFEDKYTTVNELRPDVVGGVS